MGYLVIMYVWVFTTATIAASKPDLGRALFVSTLAIGVVVMIMLYFTAGQVEPVREPPVWF